MDYFNFFIGKKENGKREYYHIVTSYLKDRPFHLLVRCV